MSTTKHQQTTLSIPDQAQHPSTIPFAKWRHFKEAFSPDIVYEAIRSSTVDVHTCIDPFGGSGTTALACQFSGVAPTTIEVNPYLADLIEAKLQFYDVERLVRDLSSILRLADSADPSSIANQLPNTFVEPGLNSRWLFNRQVADRILSIREATQALEHESHRRLFKILLGGTLLPLSNTVVNGKGRRYRRGWERHHRTAGDVDLLFTEIASTAIADLARYANRPTTTATVIRGDSRTAIDNLTQFDLAVFSPPYPNSFDYTDVYNIELWMLGYLTRRHDNRALRERTLSSHVQIYRNFPPAPPGSQQLDQAIRSLDQIVERLWSRHIPAMIAAYFADLISVIQSLSSKVISGGTISIVVGDSSYGDVVINVASILAELVTNRGFSVNRLETLREMRKSAQQGGQIQLCETLLAFTHA